MPDLSLPAHAGPPYQLNDNEYSLLDATDEVFIDAPGTGFGRLLNGTQAKTYYGIDQDVGAFAEFIKRYLTKFSRWNSPKFLFGESYGTLRSAALAERLQEQYIDFNGVVLLSAVLNANAWASDAPGGPDTSYIG